MKKMRLPISAFARADFFRIDSPFMVESQGKMDVTLANIRWEPDTSR
jgi:hypothetical protein